MTATVAGLEVRPFCGEDEPAVLSLLQTALGHGPTGHRTAEAFAWKHRDSPFGPSPGLVAEHDGRIVGVRLFLRWRLEAQGKPVQAVRAVDTATHADYRGRGIFRRLTMQLLDEVDRAGDVDLVFNTPNASSRPGYLRMGWREVGTLPVRIAPVHPARVLLGSRAAAGTIATSSHGASGSAAQPSSTPPCSLPTAREVLTQRQHEVADLLEQAARVELLHTPRTLDYLMWRYGAAPGLDYRCVCVEREGRLVGLGVGRPRWRGPLREFTLSDIVYRARDSRTARHVLWDARQAGCDHVAVHTADGTPEARRAAAKGYLRVPGHGLGLVVNPRRRIAIDPLRNGSWRLALGDLEVF